MYYLISVLPVSYWQFAHAYIPPPLLSPWKFHLSSLAQLLTTQLYVKPITTIFTQCTNFQQHMLAGFSSGDNLETVGSYKAFYRNSGHEGVLETCSSRAIQVSVAHWENVIVCLEYRHRSLGFQQKSESCHRLPYSPVLNMQ